MRGPDARWVGNETGLGRESEWSVIPGPANPDQYDWPDRTGRDLGSRDRLQGAPFLVWHPAVAAVALRQEWFWHPGKDSLKSLSELVSIYERSVGRNAVLQLGLAPDRQGKIPDADMNRLREFGQELRKRFGTDLVASGAAGVDKLTPGMTALTSSESPSLHRETRGMSFCRRTSARGSVLNPSS